MDVVQINKEQGSLLAREAFRPQGEGREGQERGGLLRRFWIDVLSSGRKALAWNWERRAGSGQICPLEKGWTLLCL